MVEALEGELRQLRTLFWSDRDPDGHGFALLADAHRRAGDLDQALELLQDGLERHPDYVSGHVALGWLHRDGGAPDDARAAFERVLELDAENVDALRGLGLLLADADDPTRAVDLLERAESLFPGDADTQERLRALRGEPVESAAHTVTPGIEPAAERDEPAGPAAGVEPPLEAEVDVWELQALAPDADAEGVADPEEPADVWNVGVLAPDVDAEEVPEPEEPADVWDVGALAPDAEAEAEEPAEPEEPAEVWDLHSLVPEAEAEEAAEAADVWDVGALAPDAEGEEAAEPQEPADVWDMHALAPDVETEEVEEPGEPADVWAMDELAPDAEADEPVVPAAGAQWLDVGVAEEPPPGGSVRFGASWEAEEVERPAEAEGGPRTRTMAELYVRQGLTDRAVRVYEHLVAQHPGDDTLRARLEELRARAVGEEQAPAEVLPDEVEWQAEELAAATGAPEGEVQPSPFAPPAEAEEAAPGEVEDRQDVVGPMVDRYFDSLLNWTPTPKASGTEPPQAAEATPAPEKPGAPSEESEDEADDDFTRWLNQLR